MRASLPRAVTVLAAVLALVAPMSPTASAAPTIPTPEQYFGFRIGTDGRLAMLDQMIGYFKLVADRSDRVDYTQLGRTTLGNPYSLLTISSRRNLDNLDRLVGINRRLADPRGLSDAEADRLAREGRPFYYVQAGIHANEVGNSQAMLEIAHRLATEHSPYIDNILDRAVILMVPTQNPDGLKLVNDYFNATAGTNYARVYPDLYQKYTGHDDNRDWFMFTQVESRLMVSIQNTYHPQAFQDAHQAGTGAPRMFTPPYLSPYDPNIDPITVQQTNDMGMTMQRGMTSAGMKGVGWGSTYDYWTPSRQYQVYHGAARLLTEAASVSNLAYPQVGNRPLGQQESGINFLEPYDSNTWTLRQIVDYTSQAFYSGVDELANDGYNWLRDFYKVGVKNSTRSSPYAFVIPAGQRDPQAVRDTLEILRTGAVEVHQALADFAANGRQYPKGSYIVYMRQPYSGFAKTLLEVQHYPMLLQYPGGPPQRPYDVTAQTLPMLLGFQADQVPGEFTVATRLLDRTTPPPVTMPAEPGPGGAYVLGPESYGVYQIVSRLQEQGIPTFRSAAAFTDAGRQFPAGTFVVPPTRQAGQLLRSQSKATGIPVHAVADVPAIEGVQLRPGTRIGLLKPPDNIPSGWLMWMFDQYRVNYSVVRASDYADLAAKYDAILMPEGVSRNSIVNGLNPASYPPEWSWAYGAGETGWNQLRDFVTGGGTLVSFGTGVSTAQQLFGLPIENVLPASSSVFYAPGSLLSQHIDASTPTGWGMLEDNPVWFEGDRAYRITDPAKYPHQVVGTYPASGEQLRSGWLIGGEYLNGAVNTVSWQVGEGNVVTFGNQPAFRTWNRAEQKMIFNALYDGPANKLTPEAFAAIAD
ncbi:M14 family zinc carboxypeptidase [Actinophytocola sp.]|uniref:M14 family zinc carboxypeptidase n=1 Tax=Actinophytocola sp. TaxID=1872138 RepID=UPI002D53D4A2|nr:M14 family zinc carboxypeptidase [Actinophytocola sp.]HYQ68512.1 M14 family zinc carboxypeptidase [Actinophytocola sp.]